MLKLDFSLDSVAVLSPKKETVDGAASETFARWLHQSICLRRTAVGETAYRFAAGYFL